MVQFNAIPAQLRQAVRKLGFTDLVEVAHGADVTTRHEAREFVERVVQQGEPFMTTSCCPSFYEAVQKHVPRSEFAKIEYNFPAVDLIVWLLVSRTRAHPCITQARSLRGSTLMQ